MQDDLDEVALNVLLGEGLDVPTSLVGATRETQVPQLPKQIPSWVQAAIVLAAMLVAGGFLKGNQIVIFLGVDAFCGATPVSQQDGCKQARECGRHASR